MVLVMAVKKRSKVQIEADRKETAALYLKGETQAAIGVRLGLSKQQIHYDLKRIRAAWLESSLQDFDAKRAKELAAIDHLEFVVWRDFDVSAEAGPGDKRYLDVVLRCIDRRCKLLGLDAPAKQELSGPDGGPIRTEDVSITEEERISRISAIFERARERRDKTAPLAAIG